MAWQPPSSGQWVCERCARKTAIVEGEGWVRLEVFEEGNLDSVRTLDFCAICKLVVMKQLKSLSTAAVKENRW